MSDIDQNSKAPGLHSQSSGMDFPKDLTDFRAVFGIVQQLSVGVQVAQGF